MTDSTNGGAAADSRRAAQRLADAVVAGDADEIKEAVFDQHAALTNQAMITVIPTLRTVLESVLKTEIAGVKSEIGRQGDIRRDQFHELEHLIDSRYDGLSVEMNTLIASQGELAHGLGKISTAVDGLTGRVSDLEESRNHLQQSINDLSTTVHHYMDGSKREDVRALQAQMREMRGDLSNEQREHYAAILMRMIAEWEAAHPDEAPPQDGGGDAATG